MLSIQDPGSQNHLSHVWKTVNHRKILWSFLINTHILVITNDFKIDKCFIFSIEWPHERVKAVETNSWIS